MLGEVVLDDQVVSPSALLARLRDGVIIEVSAYLTDEQTLGAVGLIPRSGVRAESSAD